MENKRGNGIFLGIVSIATLIVAIIGATFAYFSASTISNNGAIGATAYEYNLTLSVSPVYPSGASALIPMDAQAIIKDTNGDEWDGNDDGEAENNLLYALNYAKDKCIDDHGLQVCALYQVTIKNHAVNPITLTGKLFTNKNEAAEGKEGRTKFQNLMYQEIKGEHKGPGETGPNNFELIGAAKPLDVETTGDGVTIADIEIKGGTKSGDTITPGIGTSYVLIYLNEAGAGQSSEMGASFEGRLEYSSGDGANGLTGTFTVAAPEEEPEEDPESGE